MGQRIAVVDYNLGNLRSVAKAIEHVAGDADEVIITSDAALITSADRVVFPGQGAARDCMLAINDHHLNRAIREAAANRPFLGICMGLQVLLERSEENGGTDLLGLISGEVVHFPAGLDPVSNLPLKIPHMGWNQVDQQIDHPLWAGIASGSRFYFVHSYYVKPEDSALIAGNTNYSQLFCSALAKDNLFAVQFHPEKSADAGLQLLKNFLQWNPE